MAWVPRSRCFFGLISFGTAFLSCPRVYRDRKKKSRYNGCMEEIVSLFNESSKAFFSEFPDLSVSEKRVLLTLLSVSFAFKVLLSYKSALECYHAEVSR